MDADLISANCCKPVRRAVPCDAPAFVARAASHTEYKESSHARPAMRLRSRQAHRRRCQFESPFFYYRPWKLHAAPVPGPIMKKHMSSRRCAAGICAIFVLVTARGGEVDKDTASVLARRHYWVFQKPVQSAVPSIQSIWIKNPIGAFILEWIREKHLTPS